MRCGNAFAFHLYNSPDGILENRRDLCHSVGVDDVRDFKPLGESLIDSGTNARSYGHSDSMVGKKFVFPSTAQGRAYGPDKIEFGRPVAHSLMPELTGAELVDQYEASLPRYGSPGTVKLGIHMKERQDGHNTIIRVNLGAYKKGLASYQYAIVYMHNPLGESCGS